MTHSVAAPTRSTAIGRLPKGPLRCADRRVLASRSELPRAAWAARRRNGAFLPPARQRHDRQGRRSLWHSPMPAPSESRRNVRLSGCPFCILTCRSAGEPARPRSECLEMQLRPTYTAFIRSLLNPRMAFAAYSESRQAVLVTCFAPFPNQSTSSRPSAAAWSFLGLFRSDRGLGSEPSVTTGLRRRLRSFELHTGLHVKV